MHIFDVTLTISPGRYTLFWLPLKLHSSGGTPSRVILIRS